MKKTAIVLCLALLFLLCACGGGGQSAETPTPSESEEPTASESIPPEPTEPEPSETPSPEPVLPTNPLTGEVIDEAYVNRRPAAVMLNNIRVSLPQQGQSGADIIYELLAEGGITRMLGVYQSAADVGMIGSIRSTRTYYLELALGHDAVLIHAGGSDDAYDKLSAWKVTHLDGVNGPYLGSSAGSNLMWRDEARKAKMPIEHTVVTTGESIEKYFAKGTFRTEHEEGYTYEMNFAEDGTPALGGTAEVISVRFSNVKTGVFRYSTECGKYLVEQYDSPYTDGDTGEQIAVTNVLVLFTSCTNSGDSYNHMIIDLDGSGSGYFACGGKAVEIEWRKDSPSGQLRYYTRDGEPLTLGVGKSYVCIVPTNANVSLAGK